MIVLEGPDGAGKSTLAKQLSAALNVPIHHSGGPPKSEMEIIERQKAMIDNLRNKELMIYDRVPCISDPIYGKYIRGGSPFQGVHDPLARTMRAFLIFPIIYCRPVNQAIFNAMATRVEEAKAYKPEDHKEGVKKHVFEIIAQYDDDIAFYPHWTYDWTEVTSYMSLLHKIRAILPTPELLTP